MQPLKDGSRILSLFGSNKIKLTKSNASELAVLLIREASRHGFHSEVVILSERFYAKFGIGDKPHLAK